MNKLDKRERFRGRPTYTLRLKEKSEIHGCDHTHCKHTAEHLLKHILVHNVIHVYEHLILLSGHKGWFQLHRKVYMYNKTTPQIGRHLLISGYLICCWQQRGSARTHARTHTHTHTHTHTLHTVHSCHKGDTCTHHIIYFANTIENQVTSQQTRYLSTYTCTCV